MQVPVQNQLGQTKDTVKNFLHTNNIHIKRCFSDVFPADIWLFKVNNENT